MNAAQKRPAVSHKTATLPVMEIREGDRIALVATRRNGRLVSSGVLADDLDSALGGIAAQVMSAGHSGQGEIRLLVTHPYATHPVGYEELRVLAVDQAIVTRTW